ncbi:Dynamin-like GTPase that mediates homotypic ER fusion [Serendipita sp. 401]|nr:Dynamin-like GTPase that mediates homotypic ER fusion [Serendipita sp. 401]KAG8871576.1 Dynamin-like GTPase that mediates homotypic ER fusion [Serendipita sp. 405]KAG9056256.1 Dynamin-like GTPase that mediates homotypic ER fusion [Serendipita sp. 407]
MALVSETQHASLSAEKQLIDSRLNFYHEEDTKWASFATQVGTSYRVVSVLGSQGTGCTTLLNDIFGTHLPTMSSEVSQTTIGVRQIWSPELRSLVLDVQGASGGKPSITENKLTQFAAACSSDLIINLKQDEVCRHSTLHRGMIGNVCRTLLERYDAHDSQRTRVNVLYVIRDWDETANLESACATITRAALAVWSDISSELEIDTESTPFHEFFRLDFATLPHKILDPTAYTSQVAALAERYSSQTADSAEESAPRNDVPLQDVYEHMRRVWTIVRGRVNISDERRSLADRVCPVFIESALQFAKRCIKEKIDVEAKADDFKASSSQTQNEAMEHYDRLAALYDPDIRQKHRVTLAGAVDMVLLKCYLHHVKSLRTIALSEFKQRVTALQRTILPMPPMPSKILFPKLDELKGDCLKVFRELAIAARLNEQWTIEEQAAALELTMDDAIAPLKSQQAAIDLSMERSAAIFSRPIAPLTDIPKMISDSAGWGRMVASAIWGR